MADEEVRVFNFTGIPDGPGIEPLQTPEQAVAAEGQRQLIFTGPSPHGWHRLSIFLRCPSLYAYLYRAPGMKEASASTDYLTRGTLVHVGLAHHYLRRGIEERKGLLHAGRVERNPGDFYTPVAAVALAAQRLADQGDRWAMPLLGLAQSIVAAYLRVIAATSLDRGFKVYAVEEIATLTCGGFPYTARFDLVTEDSMGLTAVDHKVLARPKDAAAMYSHSGQIHGHRMLGHHLWGPKFRGVQLNAVSADPKDKQLIHRVVPHPAPGQVAAMPQLVFDTHAQINALDASRPWDAWPRTMACMDRFQGRCPSWDRCTGLTRTTGS